MTYVTKDKKTPILCPELQSLRRDICTHGILAAVLFSRLPNCRISGETEKGREEMTIPYREFHTRIKGAKEIYPYQEIDENRIVQWLFACYAFADDGAHFIPPVERNRWAEMRGRT